MVSSCFLFVCFLCVFGDVFVFVYVFFVCVCVCLFFVCVCFFFVCVFLCFRVFVFFFVFLCFCVVSVFFVLLFFFFCSFCFLLFAFCFLLFASASVFKRFFGEERKEVGQGRVKFCFLAVSGFLGSVFWVLGFVFVFFCCMPCVGMFLSFLVCLFLFD